jgi:hypothetical protein
VAATENKNAINTTTRTEAVTALLETITAFRYC